MTLAIPTNLAKCDGIEKIVLELLESLPRLITYHIFDGDSFFVSLASLDLVRNHVPFPGGRILPKFLNRR